VRTPLFLASAAALLTACQSSTDALSYENGPDLSPPAAGAIAGDMVSRFAEQTPGASKLLRIGEDASVFGTAMTSALKGWGYTIAPAGTKDGKPIELAYGVERIDGQVLAHVETPTLAIARGYTATLTGAEPATPLSVIQRN
jgi:hypothetical protein